jgi:glycosyltransferase involved in cell wall biosynthesis
VRIAFVYREGRVSRLEKAREGRAAREFFYGAIELERGGHEVGVFDLGYAYPPGPAVRLLDWMFRGGLLPSRVYGGLLLQARDLLPRLRAFEVVVGTTPGIAFALALWRQMGRLRAPVVAIQVGLLNEPEGAVRRTVNGWLLRRMWSQLYGDAELPGLQQRYGLPAARVVVNQFGVDTAFWTPGDGEDDGYVLAVGNDGRRDYELLVRAAGEIEAPIVVVTKLPIGGSIPGHVKVLPGSWHGEEISDEDLREMYRRARCVVIPLRDSLQPSGQSVCLQAMACGKAVVLTRTRGLWSAAMMRDGDNVLLVPPGGAGALAHAVTGIMDDPVTRQAIGARARATVCAAGEIGGFAARMGRLCERALAAGG